MNTLNYENTYHVGDDGQSVTTPDGRPVALIRERMITLNQRGKYQVYMRRTALEISRLGGDPFAEEDEAKLAIGQYYAKVPGRFHSLEAAQYQILANYIEAQEAVASRRAS